MKTLRAFLEAKHYIRIPLQKVASNHFKIKARINGISGVFILDTGASNSCLGLHCVQDFGLTPERSEIKASGAGITGIETYLAKAKQVTIQQWKVSNLEFVVFDLQHVNEALIGAEIEPVAGIIGADVLKKARAIIDYGRNCVYFK